ncbi:hypothetical protein [Mycolicibacterium vanbaalenii]|uniref:hypothetical protein n=1 Tax=Mycolicibacterium vanbaalenii TaxID=110539 RepID=UPI00190F091A|nr:hypothetical protein [Mycolicibacterium vanbaalenii]
MADVFFPSFDPAATAGAKFGPEVRAEIAEVAPSTLNNGAVTTAKLADQAVTNAKLAAGAVQTTNIAAGQVGPTNLADDAVGTSKIADNAVTPAKVDTGVPTTVAVDGTPIAMTFMYLTVSEHSAIETEDPSTTYFIVEDD